MRAWMALVDELLLARTMIWLRSRRFQDRMLTRRFAVLGCCSVLASWVIAWAQSSYPSRVIHFVVPFAAGAPDFVGRIIAQQLQSQMGQSVIVENRPAANGTIATEAVARAAPDGHTLLITSASIAVNPTVGRPLTPTLAAPL